MHKYITPHPWKIIEDKFEQDLNPNSESLFSIGNGRLGQRANFEELYSGKSLQGSYVAGVYYPDKTRVGWWKNGYPEYFAKVLNAIQWHNIHLTIAGEQIDLAKVEIIDFYRELDMLHGILSKKVTINTAQGHEVEISSERFYSIVDLDMAFTKYEVKAINNDINVTLLSYIDSDVRNSDANYDEDFWKDRNGAESYIMATTKKTGFTVAASATHKVICGSALIQPTDSQGSASRYSQTYTVQLKKGESITLEKYVAIKSSRYLDNDLTIAATQASQHAATQGYRHAKTIQSDAWQKRWDHNDITISGDVSAQQGIRFNIFQLYQTYDGSDARLNIGPKGFTGEKYGGSTYWDTEAYCLPFYMSTTSTEVARNLLIYRHQQLDKAIENATKLGFSNGAALYPMVTMNGEECHNEWEITFEEIHRNGAIAYAIYDYIRYTGDKDYLTQYGIDVLVGICRFWAQRVHWSNHKKQYVMLGVTGPNEYENNVDNNWYTNYIARWCLGYTLSSLKAVSNTQKDEHLRLTNTLSIDNETDLKKWQHIIDHMYLPEDKDLGVFLQQDGFLDKEDINVDALKTSDRPINQKWSWDRILRSPFIKQADVLQGLYFFEEEFDTATHQKNFSYYEPKTVHESSLSPCVHSILAAKLGMKDKAYEMYLRPMG